MIAVVFAGFGGFRSCPVAALEFDPILVLGHSKATLLPPFWRSITASTGRLAIKKFLITLTALAAIICGAIYVVLSPPRPVIKEVVQKAPKRLLPYEQELAKTPDQATEPQADTVCLDAARSFG